jgi:putative copper resistance protein D
MGAWLPNPHTDQHLAGGILWSAGDAVGLVFFAVLFTQWVRASMAEAKREDRRLDLLEAREARAGRLAASAGTSASGSPVGTPGADEDGR